MAYVIPPLQRGQLVQATMTNPMTPQQLGVMAPTAAPAIRQTPPAMMMHPLAASMAQQGPQALGGHNGFAGISSMLAQRFPQFASLAGGPVAQPLASGMAQPLSAVSQPLGGIRSMFGGRRSNFLRGG
jgi:hypothetical protein